MNRAWGLVMHIVMMNLSINSPFVALVLRVYRFCARVDCGRAMTTIAALVLDRASMQAFDVGKVQLGWRASAVRLREGDENLEIRLNGVSQARA